MRFQDEVERGSLRGAEALEARLPEEGLPAAPARLRSKRQPDLLGQGVGATLHWAYARSFRRTLKRRFNRATGLSPIACVQRLRIEEAKRRLERTNGSVEEIRYLVGYEDPASFRRLFRRLTKVTPGDYRRRFRLPAFAGGDVGRQA